MTQTNKTNVALSFALVAVALLAGYVLFTAFGGPSGTGTNTPPDDGTNHPNQDALDVVFVIDATASMTDEIEQVKSEVVSVAEEIGRENPQASIRYGLVLYKDTTDDFVTKVTPLSSDSQKIRSLLQSITVSGGGDFPEHVGAGLHEALSFDFRSDARSIIYLVGDAPSQRHQDGKDVASAVERAKQDGVMIRTLGCSGIESQGGLGRSEFQRIAQETGGTYRDLTYHAVITGNDGKKRSVIYEGGKTFEAERVLEDSEWAAGSDSLGDLIKPAAPEAVEKGRSAKKKSNVVDIVKDDL